MIAKAKPDLSLPRLRTSQQVTAPALVPDVHATKCHCQSDGTGVKENHVPNLPVAQWPPSLGQ